MIIDYSKLIKTGMEKQVIAFKINFLLDWTYGIDISKIRADLDAVEKLGATRIDIEHGVDYDSSYVDIDAIAERIETDEEYELRINNANKRNEETKQIELSLLETLKAKYGQS